LTEGHILSPDGEKEEEEEEEEEEERLLDQMLTTSHLVKHDFLTNGHVLIVI
jgi:hypothetical protein